MVAQFCLYTDMPFKAGEPPRSPHDWLCRFCVTSSGNPYRNIGFRRECHRCHLAKGEARQSAKVAALEKEVEQLRQATKKSEESAQPETDAPSKAAYKQAIKALGELQTTGLFADDHPVIKTLKAGLDQAKAASDESVPLSKRIRAGQNQIAIHERDLKAANDRVREPEQSIVAAQQSLEQHRAKVVEIERSLQERRNHLEQLHRQAAAEASHGARPLSCKSWYQMESPSTCPRRQRTASRKLQTSMRKNAKRRQQQKRRPHAQRKKRWSLTSSETSITGRILRLTPLPRHESRRVSTRYCRHKPEATQRDWQSCGRRMGPSGPRTQSGWRMWGHDIWCWVRNIGWRLAGVTRKPRQGWRCGFTPANRNALKAKTDSSLATSAGTFVAAPKHWGLEWAWPARGWQSKELQDQRRLTMAWVPIMGGITVFSVYFYHSEERNQQLLEATSREIRRCPGLWILAGDFNMEPETLGQYATPARLPGVWSNQQYPPSGMERRFVALTSLWCTA